MSQFDHRFYIYLSLDTTNRDRFSISRHIELLAIKDVVERVTVSRLGIGLLFGLGYLR